MSPGTNHTPNLPYGVIAKAAGAAAPAVMMRRQAGSSRVNATTLAPRARYGPREIVVLAPLRPRAVVAPQPRKAEQPEREVGMSGGLPVLAVGRNVHVGCDAMLGKMRQELSRRLHGPIGCQVLRPRNVARPRNMPFR